MIARIAVLVVALSSGLLLALRHREPDHTVDVARQIGLTPETLTVSGCSATDAAGALSRIRSESGQAADVLAKVAALEARAHDLADAAAALRANPRNETLRTALQTATAQRDAAIAALRDSGDTMRATATAGLTTTQIARLARCRDNMSRRVPTSFWVATADDWGPVEKAVVEEKRALRTQSDVPSAAATTLASVRAQSDVAAADSLLGSTLAAVKAAFEAQ